jgi:hypothetical protein
MKVILRGSLIDISFIYEISEITNYKRDLDSEYFSEGINPEFTINFINGNSLVIEEKWLKTSINGNSSYDIFYGKYLTETEYPKWKEAYERLKKTRDELTKLWLNNQTEIPIIK